MSTRETSNAIGIFVGGDRRSRRNPRPGSHSSQNFRPGGVGLLTALVLTAVAPLAPLRASAQVEGLSLQKALAKAIERNRQLAAFAYLHAEDEGRLQQASQLPNPEIYLEIENFAGEGFEKHHQKYTRKAGQEAEHAE